MVSIFVLINDSNCQFSRRFVWIPKNGYFCDLICNLEIIFAWRHQNWIYHIIATYQNQICATFHTLDQEMERVEEAWLERCFALAFKVIYFSVHVKACATSYNTSTSSLKTPLEFRLAHHTFFHRWQMVLSREKQNIKSVQCRFVQWCTVVRCTEGTVVLLSLKADVRLHVTTHHHDTRLQ